MRRTIVVLVAVAALVIGYLAGTVLTCGDDCAFNVILFDALGTWAGGVGVAAIAAWFTLNRRRADRAEAAIKAAAKEQAHRDAEALRLQVERDAETLRSQVKRDAELARRDAAERNARVPALMCTLRFRPLGNEQNGFERAHIEFKNVLDEVVFWPQLKKLDGTDLATADEQVWPTRVWGKDVPLAELGLDASYPNESAAREAINRVGRSQVVFEFTVRDIRFARVLDKMSIVGDDRQPR